VDPLGITGSDETHRDRVPPSSRIRRVPLRHLARNPGADPVLPRVRYQCIGATPDCIADTAELASVIT